MPVSADLPPVLTVPEAAEYLRVCERTVYNLIRDGHLATLPQLRHKRIPRPSIESFLGTAAAIAS